MRYYLLATAAVIACAGVVLVARISQYHDATPVYPDTPIVHLSDYMDAKSEYEIAPAITRALNAAQKKANGSTVVMPEGIFNTHTGIVITQDFASLWGFRTKGDNLRSDDYWAIREWFYSAQGCTARTNFDGMKTINSDDDIYICTKSGVSHFFRPLIKHLMWIDDLWDVSMYERRATVFQDHWPAPAAITARNTLGVTLTYINVNGLHYCDGVKHCGPDVGVRIDGNKP